MIPGVQLVSTPALEAVMDLDDDKEDEETFTEQDKEEEKKEQEMETEDNGKQEEKNSSKCASLSGLWYYVHFVLIC